MSDMVRVLSIQTPMGEWCISTERKTFAISAVSYGFTYSLSNSKHTDFSSAAETPYKHILAVAQHRTGLPEWDSSEHRVSDYAKDWELELDKAFQMSLLADYLDRCPNDSMRRLDSYFHHKHSYCMGRMTIVELFRELITTGQLDTLPSMHMAPSEFFSLARLDRKWILGDET